MSDTQRLIDANANRAREAMRVMEDAARFLLDDAELSAAFKQLRHVLAEALSNCDDWILSRDTPEDVGTLISTDSEGLRQDERAVVIAAGKRLSEALRTMEEYAKTYSDVLLKAKTIEQIRYRGYELERQLVSAMGSKRRSQWQVCVLVSESLCLMHPWKFVVEDIIRTATCDAKLCLQLREKTLDDAELLVRSTWLVQTCRSSGVASIINDRPDIAALSKADGVHLGQTDMPVAAARRILGFNAIIGVSTSCLDDAHKVLREGGDYCGVGPMFETKTKDKPVLAGPQYLREYSQWNKLPHLAIGGINATNIATLIDAGVRGVAVSHCVCSAKSPGDVVQALLDSLNSVTT